MKGGSLHLNLLWKRSHVYIHHTSYNPSWHIKLTLSCTFLLRQRCKRKIRSVGDGELPAPSRCLLRCSWALATVRLELKTLQFYEWSAILNLTWFWSHDVRPIRRISFFLLQWIKNNACLEIVCVWGWPPDAAELDNVLTCQSEAEMKTHLQFTSHLPQLHFAPASVYVPSVN